MSDQPQHYHYLRQQDVHLALNLLRLLLSPPPPSEGAKEQQEKLFSSNTFSHIAMMDFPQLNILFLLTV